MLQSHLSSNCLLWPVHKALSDLALSRLMFTLPSPWVLIPIPGPLHMPQPGMLSPRPIWISSFRLPKYCSVPQSCLTLWPCALQLTRLPCPSLSPGVCSNSRPLSQWCHPTIASSVASFSFCHWSFPASGSFSVSLPFPSGITCLEILTLCNLPSSVPWYYCCWTPFIATDYLFTCLPYPPPPICHRRQTQLPAHSVTDTAFSHIVDNQIFFQGWES